MRRNDIIAEYIETRYPHLLKTTDFALFSMRVVGRELVKKVTERMINLLSVLNVGQLSTLDQKQIEEKDNV